MSKEFKKRTTPPSSNDKNWIRWDKKGYNYCTQRTGNTVLPNCTGYAWGRWRELLGKFHELSRGDAEVWWGKQDGYKRGKTPKLGAIIAWRKGIAGNKADGAGHVAVVEEILEDGTIITSNSDYGGTTANGRLFYMQTLKPPYNRPGLTLQGFIYIPVDYVAPKPKPIEPKPTDPKVGDTVKVNGRLFTSSNGSIKGITNHKNKEAKIERIIKNAKHPYYVKGKSISGWANLEHFGKVETATAPKPIAKGDKVKLLKAIRYDTGKKFNKWRSTYDVISVNGNRVVIGVGNKITAPVHKDNLEKIS